MTQLGAVVLGRKKKKQAIVWPTEIIHATVLAEEITNFFEEDKGGLYSDMAWYDVLQDSFDYVTGSLYKQELISKLSFTFGFEDVRDLDVVEKRTSKRLRDMKRSLYGKED